MLPLASTANSSNFPSRWFLISHTASHDPLLRVFLALLLPFISPLLCSPPIPTPYLRAPSLVSPHLRSPLLFPSHHLTCSHLPPLHSVFLRSISLSHRTPRAVCCGRGARNCSADSSAPCFPLRRTAAGRDARLSGIMSTQRGSSKLVSQFTQRLLWSCPGGVVPLTIECCTSTIGCCESTHRMVLYPLAGVNQPIEWYSCTRRLA